MRKVWEIAWLYLYTTYKDRSTFLYGFALPLIFTFVIGVGISGFASQGETTWRLDVVDRDRSDLSAQLIERLDAETILEAEVVDEAAAAGDAAATLTLPAGLSQQLQVGERLNLEFRLNLEEPASAQVVEQAVQAALNGISSVIDIAETSQRVADRLGLFEVTGAPGREDYYRASLEAGQRAWQAGAPITVEASQLTRREDTAQNIPIGFAQTSPGVGVMFTMFFIAYGGAAILLEREQGTLRRLLTMPVSKTAILAGKVLGVFIAGGIQFTIMVLAGQFLFGVDWGGEPLALAVMIVAFVLCITCFSMLLAALARSYAQIDALSTLIILPLAALGGAMWPIEIVPPFMQQIALLLPTGWAMRGFHDIITRGLGLADVLPEAGVLLAFGAAFLAIGVWRFKYE
jgi:ABC-2 type transport system permease protein